MMSVNTFTKKTYQIDSSDAIKFGDMPLFNGVDMTLLSGMLDRCSVTTFDEGELLLDPNQGNQFFYLILDGVVSVYLDNPDSPPIASLSVGECVGEMSMFDGKNPSAYVKASENVKVLAMDNATLWEMIDLSHGLARNLLYLLSKRVRTGNCVVTDSLQMQKQHEKEANSDSLTGLNNRRWLDELLLRLKGKALGELAPLCLMMLDIDHFKKFNDTYGHQMGDSVLRTVAGVMQQRLRPSDMVGRYGGEEFIVLLPGSSMAAAKSVAERLRQGVEAQKLEYEDKQLEPVTVSIGLAQWDGGQKLEALIADADSALYQAKEQGRNRYMCAKESSS